MFTRSCSLCFLPMASIRRARNESSDQDGETCTETSDSFKFSVLTKASSSASCGMICTAFLIMYAGPQFLTALSLLSRSSSLRNWLPFRFPKNIPKTGFKERSITMDEILISLLSGGKSDREAP